ncbi:hypothetical protein DEIPH_ctg031orf0104 [Deinococcus phoenicis]|uniref:TMEM205-like domain-containing protein n=1 Tax=Deinococcus phoenicis TaxID=1476583 RepID=A0A016QPN6_9DEIO|nr:DUF4149 domain-containing protein [Deinococcus phoenicis]EYB67956.1 hypothetical protein DEIPH_ctg031orf0104 [Deinococcus phoenicis]
MTVLTALNVLLVGAWVGMYVFTTFVVSPAFTELFPDEATRSAHRRTVGRYYARVNGPISLLLLLTVLAQGVTGGFSPALLAELGVLLLIGGLVSTHVRRAERVRPPAWIAHTTLAASALLCGLALAAHG